MKPSQLARYILGERIENTAEKIRVYSKSKIKDMYCNSNPKECPQFKKFEQHLNKEVHRALQLERMVEGIKGLNEF